MDSLDRVGYYYGYWIDCLDDVGIGFFDFLDFFELFDFFEFFKGFLVVW